MLNFFQVSGNVPFYIQFMNIMDNGLTRTESQILIISIDISL